MAKVSVTNITVNVNEFQEAYSRLGLGQIPAGVTVSTVVSKIEAKLAKDLSGSWPDAFPAYASYQEDSAIMAPWKANVAGKAPKCVTQAITQDFTSWDLPVDTNTITEMAKQITQEVANNGGLSGTFYGRSQLGGAETLYWGVGFATAPVINQPEEMGIIYVFSAVLGLN
ncbi:hypothetical protein [Winogradskyella sp. 3972H.M.0a.05]|uniref:hypothetical protein n=1 Tax=Winogradskyella sp. 3972H.M.0a.05 TaxID=2950277 RepID=UPI00339146E9